MFVLLSITQFHVPYYAGRTLPNFLALPPVILAFSMIVRATDLISPDPTITENKISSTHAPVNLHKQRQRLQIALAILTFTATVVRLEVAPMAVAIAAILVARKDLSSVQAVVSGAVGGFTGLGEDQSYVHRYFMLMRSVDRDCRWVLLRSDLPPFGLVARALGVHVQYPSRSRCRMGRDACVLLHHYSASPDIGLVLLLEHGVRPGKRDRIACPPFCCYHLRTESRWPQGESKRSDVKTPLTTEEWRFIVYVVPLINVLAAQAVARM